LKNSPLKNSTVSHKSVSKLLEAASWAALANHYREIEPQQMRDLFADDPTRFEKFSIQFEDILLDFSKNRINETTIKLLCDLAEQAGVREWTERMFSGDKINHTEGRAVLHTALRCRSDRKIEVDGVDVMPEIRQQLEKMRDFSEAVRTRSWRGYSGQPITDVVNIGVGGSDLGPLMACEALRPYGIHDLRMHFVSNVDESHIIDTLEHCRPETTLFIVASKSFTTADTMINAETSREWFLNGRRNAEDMRQHFVAVTANSDAATSFGIADENIFRIWDWVGGRYSLWSAMGLSVAISTGMKHFDEMLDGAHAIDEHFRTAPFEKNIPAIMGLLGVWYNNFFGAPAHAVLPYDQHLHRFPPYLRQTDMESNGKRIDRDGNEVDYDTGPIIFGQLGITGQHAFYQLMHQGTKMIPADFIAPVWVNQNLANHRQSLMSNVFAQTEALMRGKDSQEAVAEMRAQGMSESDIESLLPYKIFPGNKPTNTILFDELTPYTLGALIALYEHKVFVQGVIWNINSYDQWGVELGKQLAARILPELNSDVDVNTHDSSTNGLINYYKSRRRPDQIQ